MTFSCSPLPKNFPAKWTDITGVVRQSVNRVCRDDKFLLTKGANERAVAHRLAVYLENDFSDWNIDCEYNRLGDSSDPKRQPRQELLSLLRDREKFLLVNELYEEQVRRAEEALLGRGVNGEPSNLDRLAYPDLIVHRRKCGFHNLLVVEIKTSGAPSWQTLIDFAKLTSFSLESDLADCSEEAEYPRYQFGLFLEFGTAELSSALLFQGGNGVVLEPSSLQVRCFPE